MVISKAKRILGPMESFQDYESNLECVIRLTRNMKFLEDEVPIGIYTFPPESDECIVVTSRGLYLVTEDSANFIAYSEIEQVDTPRDKQARYLTLCLTNGESKILPIRGGKGRFRDTFEFMRFLMRVTGK